jgi:hypothetical protein
MRNNQQPFIPILGNRFSTATGGDQEFYGGKPPFMAAMLPQAWDTGPSPYGRTDSDIKGIGMPQPLIFNLNGLAILGKGLFHPAVARLPASGDTLYGITGTDEKDPPMLRPTIFALNGLKVSMGGLFHPVIPVPPQVPGPSYAIQGITRDAEGNPIAEFTVFLFNVTSGTPVLEQTATSDGSGLYSFTVIQGQTYWVVEYKSGTPDMTGATADNLTGGINADIFAYDPETPPDITPVGSLLTNISSGSQEILISANLAISV